MASKIPGYKGQLLDIDLTTKKISTLDLDPKLARDYIGGRALGGKMLMDAYGANWAKRPARPDALLCSYRPIREPAARRTWSSSRRRATASSAQGSGDFIHELRFGYDGDSPRQGEFAGLHHHFRRRRSDLRCRRCGAAIRDAPDDRRRTAPRPQQSSVRQARTRQHAAVITEWVPRGRAAAGRWAPRTKAVSRGTGARPRWPTGRIVDEVGAEPAGPQPERTDTARP
jgi:hypothetical protein